VVEALVRAMSEDKLPEAGNGAKSRQSVGNISGKGAESRVLRVLINNKFREDTVNVEVNSTATVREIKLAIGKMLFLDTSSLEIFGVFKVQSLPHNPSMEVCNDDEILPRNMKQVLFKRLCFDRAREILVVIQDFTALSLIFFEGSEFIENGTSLYNIHLVPIHELSLFERLRSISSSINNPDLPMVQKVKRMTDYVRNLHNLDLSYWTYFYRYLQCTLCGENAPMVAAYLNLNSNYVVDVCLSRTSLSFLGTTATGLNAHLVDFPWLTIRWISKNSKKGTISFELLVKYSDTSVGELVVTFKSEDFHMLFSVAKHILKIHAKAKTEALVCNLMLEEDKIVLAKSLIPDGNKELKVFVMKEILEAEPRGKSLSSELVTALEEAPEVFPNELYIDCPIDLWSILLNNVQSPVTSDSGPLTIVFRFTNNDDSMKRSVSSIKRTSTNPTRMVIVHTFSGDPIYICLLPRHRLVKFFKLSLAAHLKIKRTSLDAFGLFECFRYGSPYDNTGRLCLDNESMPDASVYVFRRLSFESTVEDRVCHSDRNALDLLLSEAKYMLMNSRVLPVLPKSLQHNLCKATLTANSYVKLTQTDIATFWWTNYYRAEIEEKSIGLCDQSPAQFSVTLTGLVLVEPCGTFWTHVPWEVVRCITIVMPEDPDKYGAVLVESIHPPTEDDVVLNTKGYVSENFMFFYSIASYILSQKPKSDKSTDEFVNCTFQGPSSYLADSPLTHHTVNHSFDASLYR